MSKKFNFDFCIIPNPFSNGTRNIIFISKFDENISDKEKIEDEDYFGIKKILDKFGYTETSQFKFESSNNETSIKHSIIEIKKKLEKHGLKYNRELEVIVVRDLSILKKDFNEKNILIESESKNFKHLEPDLKEKIKLNFYLFLEFGFNYAGKPVIQFGGDFESNESDDNRNYIKIVESDFERVFDSKKPNSIILSSVKTQSDFLKEIGLLYGGFFKYQTIYEGEKSVITKEKKYPYKLIEVKKFLRPEQSIVIETNRFGYDKLINLSNEVKLKRKNELRNSILISELEEKSNELNTLLESKMIFLSENEEFESAANIKKDIEMINNRLSFVKKLEKPEITLEEYFKIFSLS